MNLPAIFAILVGAGMIAQWAISYFSRQIPELETEPYRIGFHIAAEMATAVSLILGGIGLLASQPWGPVVFLLSTGMLIYTLIASPGYFAQKGQRVWVWIFGILLLLAIASTVAVAARLAG